MSLKLKIKKIKFLKNTIKYYATNRRGTRIDGSLGCSYIDGCAIGRHLSSDLCNKLDVIGSINNTAAYQMLPEKLQKLERHFLYTVQTLHDTNNFWKSTESEGVFKNTLTDLGEKMAETILQKISVSAYTQVGDAFPIISQNTVITSHLNPPLTASPLLYVGVGNKVSFTKTPNANSGISAYGWGSDYIVIQFTSGDAYTYTVSDTITQEEIDTLINLANSGRGLNTYINKHQNIKTGFSHVNNHADLETQIYGT
jgi:hypothetical protein